MAGKIAQLKEILTKDTLAKQLSALYSNWWTQRSAKETEWRETRNYIFATDTTKTTNSKLPWKNKTTLPKLTQIRDNLHANYMDALFPNDNWMKWEGHNLEDSTYQKRRAIESYLKTKIRTTTKIANMPNTHLKIGIDKPLVSHPGSFIIYQLF